MARQLRLGLKRAPSFAREELILGPSNAAAAAILQAWPNWHGRCLALFGAEGVGKTHFARVWAEDVGAVVLDRRAPDLAAAAGQPVLLEDVDQGAPDEALFHLVNMAGHAGGGLLLTARRPPSTWDAALPDLQSRLRALPVAEIAAPDDEILTGVLRKLFRERNIRPPEDVYQYLIRRMERSIPQAREIVRLLDEAADSEQRPVSRALAKQILEGDFENLDLFG